jgi:hypothetical protein
VCTYVPSHFSILKHAVCTIVGNEKSFVSFPHLAKLGGSVEVS